MSVADGGASPQLEDLKQALLRMGGLVEEMTAAAVAAVAEQNRAAAHAVIERDQRVDQEELLVDEICLALLRQQPESQELRYITAGMKMSTDLERMADLAVGIARRAESLMDRPLPRFLDRIGELAEIVCLMLRKALQSFVSLDAEVARGLGHEEREVDRRCGDLELQVKELLGSGQAAIDACIALLLISRALERIGDHVTNIAEDVIFIAEGRVARHSPWMRSS